MKKHNHRLLSHTPVLSTAFGAALAAGLLAASPQAHALDQIMRDYQSFRSAGMGGVRTTTGLYDENFFSNPARVTANPKSKFELLQTGAEMSNIGNVSSVIDAASNDGDIVKALSDQTGTNTHLRFQEEPLAFFLASNENRHWALGIGIMTSLQFDTIVRQGYAVGIQGTESAGPAVTFGYKLLEDKLSVGLTSHVLYRFNVDPSLTFSDLLAGKSLSPKENGSQGMGLDFDIGATY
jgi:hypothetical protein